MAARRVLVIDRHPAGLEALTELCRVWGFDVEGCPTGGEGLAAVLARPPEIVIMEPSLSDMDGCDVIRQMRSAPRDVFIIAYSAYEELMPRVLAVGADAAVLKPNIEGLKDRLRVERAVSISQRRRKSGSDHRG